MLDILGPEDVLPPVQIISVNGEWRTDTGQALPSNCEEGYYTMFTEVVFQVA